MDKYKLLLTGKNKVALDDFFTHLSDKFDLLSTSMHLNDMIRHVELFEPDVFVYCMKADSREELLRMKELKRELTRKGISTIVLGNEEECENFGRIAVYMSDLNIHTPASMNLIRDEITKYLDGVEKERQEQKMLQDKLIEIQERKERKHVLVIDDDPMQLKLIKEYLHENYDVATAISGRIARKFLETKKTNFILLDYEMPVETGPEVLKSIRENPEFDSVPVVFLTGITDREKIQTALMLKPQGYLLKPIDQDKLLGTIEKFIG